jgi:hypothetical protein
VVTTIQSVVEQLSELEDGGVFSARLIVEIVVLLLYYCCCFDSVFVYVDAINSHCKSWHTRRANFRAFHSTRRALRR